MINLNITREKLKEKKLEILNLVLTEEEKKNMQKQIEDEIEEILLKFKENNDEGMIDE